MTTTVAKHPKHFYIEKKKELKCHQCIVKLCIFAMDDQLEDKIFSQVYINSMKLLSKFAVTIPPLSSWGLFRFYLCAVVLFIVLFYLQAAIVWPRGLLHRISTSFGYTRKINRLQTMTTNSPEKKQSWEETKEGSSVFAVQGRRLKMEDR